MNKTYQLKTLDTQGQSRTQSLEAGSGKAPLLVPTAPGERHLLLDVQQGSAPDNIRLQRVGKQLRVFFGGSSQPDLVLENFYSGNASAEAVTLAGTTDQGGLYAYQPETGQAQDTVSQLADNAPPQGMALGGAPLPAFTETVAAAGLLAPVAAGGLGIGAIGAGLLGVAAIGGGGGGSGSTVSQPAVSALSLSANSDSGNPNDQITAVQTPTIKGKATAGSQVSVSLNNKIYTTSADPQTGEFRITVPEADALKAGRYTLQATAKATGLTSNSFDGTAFVVDISSADNVDAADGSSALDPNTSATLSIAAMSDDTGLANDFVGSDSTLIFSGRLDRFSDNGDKIRATLDKVGGSGNPLYTAFLTPDPQLGWRWDLSGQTLAPGRYALKAALVDGAGNIVSTAQDSSAAIKSQVIVVDNDPAKNVDGQGNLVDDANATSHANVLIGSVSLDSGRNSSDFITNDNTVIFKGSIEHFTDNGDRVLAQLKNDTGTVLRQDMLSPLANQWSWDLSASPLNDGRYILDAHLVDAAGNTVSSTQAAMSQTVVIDTARASNVQENGQAIADANAALAPNIVGLSEDTQAPTDWITTDNTPSLSGNFGTGKLWNSNGDGFRFQVFNANGFLLQEVGDAAISADRTSWSAHLTTLDDGVYLGRAFVSDLAGNVISQDQQAFVIDHTAPRLNNLKLLANQLDGVVSSLTLVSNEFVRFTITNGNGQLISGDYNNSLATLNDKINGTFATGTFQIIFKDTAGNESVYTNTSPLIFRDIAVNTEPSSSYQPPKTPNLSGAVGRYTLATDQTLDLTAILLDQSQNPAIHNSIDMGHSSSQQLRLGLNDVLSLGVVNSFVNDGRVQLMVQGDAHDRVTFKEILANPSQTTWASPSDVTVNGVHYQAYVSNDNLAEVLIQQGVVVA